MSNRASLRTLFLLFAFSSVQNVAHAGGTVTSMRELSTLQKPKNDQPRNPNIPIGIADFYQGRPNGLDYLIPPNDNRLSVEYYKFPRRGYFVRIFKCVNGQCRRIGPHCRIRLESLRAALMSDFSERAEIVNINREIVVAAIVQPLLTLAMCRRPKLIGEKSILCLQAAASSLQYIRFIAINSIPAVMTFFRQEGQLDSYVEMVSTPNNLDIEVSDIDQMIGYVERQLALLHPQEGVGTQICGL